MSTTARGGPVGRAVRGPSGEQRLLRELQRTAERIRLVDLATAGFILAVAWTTYLLAVAAVDQALRPTGLPGWLRQVVFAAFAVGSGVFAWLRLIRPAFQKVSLLYAAWRLEKSARITRHAVTTYLDLRQRPLPRLVREALRREAQEDLRYTDPEAAAPPKPAMRWFFVLVVLIIFLGVFALLVPEQFISLMGRAIWPFGPMAIPSNTRFELLEPTKDGPYNEPQRQAVLEIPVKRGQNIVVHGRVHGLAPPEVWLETWAQEGEQPYRRSMTAIDDYRTEWKFTLGASELPASGLFFRMVGGDGQSRVYRLVEQLVNPPQVREFDITIHYPAYTGREPKKQTVGDIEAVVGSEVELAVYGDQPISDGQLVLEYGETKRENLQLIQAPERDPKHEPNRVFLDGRLRLEEKLFPKARYGIWLNNQLRQSGQIQWYDIRLIADRPPVITLEKVNGIALPVAEGQEPARPPALQIPVDAAVPVEGTANDDFAVDRVWLVLQELEGEQRLLRIAHERGQTGPLQKANGFTPIVPARYQLVLDLQRVVAVANSRDIPQAAGPLRLTPGTKLKLWVEGTDCKEPEPNVGRSREVVVELVDPKQPEQKPNADNKPEPERKPRPEDKPDPQNQPQESKPENRQESKPDNQPSENKPQSQQPDQSQPQPNKSKPESGSQANQDQQPDKPTKPQEGADSSPQQKPDKPQAGSGRPEGGPNAEKPQAREGQGNAGQSPDKPSAEKAPTDSKPQASKPGQSDGTDGQNKPLTKPANETNGQNPAKPGSDAQSGKQPNQSKPEAANNNANAGSKPGQASDKPMAGGKPQTGSQPNGDKPMGSQAGKPASQPGQDSQTPQSADNAANPSKPGGSQKPDPNASNQQPGSANEQKPPLANKPPGQSPDMNKPSGQAQSKPEVGQPQGPGSSKPAESSGMASSGGQKPSSSSQGSGQAQANSSQQSGESQPNAGANKPGSGQANQQGGQEQPGQGQPGQANAGQQPQQGDKPGGQKPGQQQAGNNAAGGSGESQGQRSGGAQGNQQGSSGQGSSGQGNSGASGGGQTGEPQKAQPNARDPQNLGKPGAGSGGANPGLRREGEAGDSPLDTKPMDANPEFAREAGDLTLDNLRKKLERGEIDKPTRDLMERLGVKTPDELKRLIQQKPKVVQAEMERGNRRAIGPTRSATRDNRSAATEADERPVLPPELRDAYEDFTRRFHRP